MLGPSPCMEEVATVRLGAKQTNITRYLLLVPEVVRRGDEDHGVDPLAVPLEGAHAGALLVALAQLGHVEEPGLAGLVEGGGEDEVSGEQDPGGGHQPCSGGVRSHF